MSLCACICKRPGCQRWVRSLFANVFSCQLPRDVLGLSVSMSLCSVSLCVAVFLSEAHRLYGLALPLPINPCLWRHTDPWVSEEEQKCSVKRLLTGTNKDVKFHALLFILLLRAALKQQHVTWSLGTLP